MLFRSHIENLVLVDSAPDGNLTTNITDTNYDFYEDSPTVTADNPHYNSTDYLPQNGYQWAGAGVNFVTGVGVNTIVGFMTAGPAGAAAGAGWGVGESLVGFLAGQGIQMGVNTWQNAATGATPQIAVPYTDPNGYFENGKSTDLNDPSGIKYHAVNHVGPGYIQPQSLNTDAMPDPAATNTYLQAGDHSHDQNVALQSNWQAQSAPTYYDSNGNPLPPPSS